MKSQPFTLKTPPVTGEGYPRSACAASRCLRAIRVTYASESKLRPRPWDQTRAVPLCDQHHASLCDWQDAKAADVIGELLTLTVGDDAVPVEVKVKR